MANLTHALDAAYPPSPEEWVADLQSVNAKVAFVYSPTFGGGGDHPNSYTIEHVQAAQAAGIAVIPIVVPGNNPPAPPLYAAAWPFGIKGGSIVYDIARGDGTPAPSWELQAIEECNAASPAWDPWCYLQPGLRPTFPWGKEWAAIPGAEPTSLPTGCIGIQYSGKVINGHSYDISVIDLDAVVAGPLPDPVVPEAPVAPAPAPVPVAPAPTVQFENITVQSGNTESGLAAADNEPLSEFEADNAAVAPDPNKIFPGEVLRERVEGSAPVAPAPAPVASKTEQVVVAKWVAGQVAWNSTWWGIGQHLGINYVDQPDYKANPSLWPGRVLNIVL